MVPANKTFKAKEILENPEAFVEAASTGGLGRKLALLRLLSGANIEVAKYPPDTKNGASGSVGLSYRNSLTDNRRSTTGSIGLSPSISTISVLKSSISKQARATYRLDGSPSKERKMTSSRVCLTTED